MDALGFLRKKLRNSSKAISKPNGIILVTGATGTGKSTVYAILETLIPKIEISLLLKTQSK